MIEPGMFLYFIPPRFASGMKNSKHIKRLMLVINIINRYNKYVKNNRIELTSFTKNEIIKENE